MKLFSWLNETPAIESDGETSAASEPPLSPVLQERLVELEKQKVKDVMTPRPLVSALDADVQLRRVRRLKSSKVAHFPVYKGDLDHILGWISKARVLELLNENPEENRLADFVRPVGVVSEEASVAELADHFLRAASPFLVVKNSHGSTTGIISLADFVELIFGFELSAPAASSATETPAPALRGYEL
jgi:putative hemolysin